MDFKYEINDANEVLISYNDMPVINQPISPVTGEPFASYDEAKAWAEADILQRISWLTAPIAE